MSTHTPDVKYFNNSTLFHDFCHFFHEKLQKVDVPWVKSVFNILFHLYILGSQFQFIIHVIPMILFHETFYFHKLSLILSYIVSTLPKCIFSNNSEDFCNKLNKYEITFNIRLLFNLGGISNTCLISWHDYIFWFFDFSQWI